ncbi:MAG: hypothetical protein JWQ74_2663 [Marmoricola sp.]|nr:hypothetical protein [Marmoricola sp.]
MLSRSRVPVWLLLGLLLAGCADAPVPAARARSAPVESTEPTAIAVLHAWDGRRSAAWLAGDVRALATLYLPGSAAGTRDVALLSAYTARGLRLTGMRTQVLSVRTVRSSANRIAVEVVDRVVDASVDDGTAVRRLPTGQPERRRLDLRRVGTTWVVAAVRPLPTPVRR